jgi:hypothetical protein
MGTDLEARILELLHAAPGRTLPLREVHRALVAEIGSRIGSLEQLRERLSADPGSLLIIQPDDPLGDGAAWPEASRAEYQRALRDAGLETEPWVTAFVEAGASPIGTRLIELDRSLIELWEAAADRPALRAAIACALTEVRVPHDPARLP